MSLIVARAFQRLDAPERPAKVAAGARVHRRARWSPPDCVDASLDSTSGRCGWMVTHVGAQTWRGV
jgi:hypothetical protein